MKTVIYTILLIFIGCSSADEPKSKVIKSLPTYKSVTVKTKMDSMLDIISYVDSAQVVEKQVQTITKLKEKNEELEIMVEKADNIIREINTELTETRKVVRSITSDSVITPFELLPIQ